MPTADFDYRAGAFNQYISAGFGEHTTANFESVSRHYAFNYLRFLPQDRNAPILEIGCGMGHFLFFLKEQGYTNVVGLDVGKEQVEYTNSLLGAEKALLVDSTENFLANGGRYSSIVMLNVIEHVRKDKIIPLLQQIHDALSDGGILIVKTDNVGCVTGTFNRYFDFTHEIGFVESSLKQVLHIAGFRKTSFVEEQIPPPYSNKTRLWLVLVRLYRQALRLAYEFERRGNTMPTIWGKDLTAISWK